MLGCVSQLQGQSRQRGIKSRGDKYRSEMVLVELVLPQS